MFCKAGFEVYGIESNKERLRKIMGDEYFFEPQVSSYLGKYHEKFHPTDDYQELKTVK